MSEHDSEFSPGNLDAQALALSIYADIEAFSNFVGRELLALQLFGSIVCKLLEERSNEIRLETMAGSEKVGLELAEITGSPPEFWVDSEAPIVQNVIYPPVSLPDGNYALLKQEVHRRN